MTAQSVDVNLTDAMTFQCKNIIYMRQYRRKTQNWRDSACTTQNVIYLVYYRKYAKESVRFCAEWKHRLKPY